MGKAMFFPFSLVLLSFIWGNVSNVDAINVLLVPGPLAGSRLMLMNFVGSKLVARNHNVTIFVNEVGEVERSNELQYNEVGDSVVKSVLPQATSLNVDWNHMTSADNVEELTRLEEAWCRAVLSSDTVSRFNSSGYDVALVDSSVNLCVMGVLHVLGVPYMQFLSSTFGMSHPADPAMSSYVPAYGTVYSDKMTLSERTHNFLMANIWGKYVRAHYYEAAQVVFDEFYANSNIDLELVSKEASLFLLNSDYTIEYIRPLPPTIVMVGGFHCQQKVALPQDVSDWFADGSDAGVVVFNLGSVVNLQAAPDHVMEAFISAFTILKPMRFLIIAKSGLSAHITDMLPDNVKMVKWINLQATLGHVNTRLFISHGGTSSMLEAVCHGIPVLGVPLFDDHLKNLLVLRDKGVARVISKSNLTADNIATDIADIVTEPTYKDSALRQAMLLRDHPLTAINRAVYWVEYVARHRGTRHLRCAALDLNVARRYQLDVLACLVAAPAAVTALVLLVLSRWALAPSAAESKQPLSTGRPYGTLSTSAMRESVAADSGAGSSQPLSSTNAKSVVTKRKKK